MLGGDELEGTVTCREKLIANGFLGGVYLGEAGRLIIELRKGFVNMEVYFAHKKNVKGGDAHCFVNLDTANVQKIIIGY